MQSLRHPRSALAFLAVFLSALSGACSNSQGPAPLPVCRVSSQLPLPDSTGAARSPEIVVTLSDDIDPTSVATGQVVVSTALGPVLGLTTADGPRALRWATTVNLPWGTVVTVTLLGGVRSLAGALLASDQTWRFRVQDPLPTGFTLPIAALDPFRCVVAHVPAHNEFVVAAGPDVWVVPALPPGTLTPQPSHELFPFAPSFVAANRDGALAGANLDDRGQIRAPAMVLSFAHRRTDGTWQTTAVDAVRGSLAELAGFDGGHAGAFTAHLVIEAAIAEAWMVGPRPTPPMFATFQNTSTTAPITVTAIDLDTVVVCRASVAPGQPARFQRIDLRSSAPLVTRTWEQPFGLLSCDGDGNLLVLSQSGTSMTLELQGADGTVAGSATAGVDPPAQSLAGWRILPARGTAAAIRIGTSGGTSIRLDASEQAPRARSFTLPQGTLDTERWDACYAPNGDLLLVARVQANEASDGALVLWRQRPGSDWEGGEIVAEVQGRPLGKPGIAVDPDGLPLIAVPRSAPAEIVVIQGRPQVQVPALR
jgi:hypothetical protein